MSYRERLTVPPAWWAVSLVVTAFGVLEMASGFTWPVAVVAFVVLAGFFIVPLLVLGLAVVRVTDGRLVAGGKELPLSDIRSATALAPDETKHRLGPGADPAAHVVLRSWIKTSVLVQPHAKSAPYWLVSTRHPQELAAALRPPRG